MNLTTEECPHCETVVEIPDNKASRCPKCEVRILPCNACKEEHICNWSKDMGCRVCAYKKARG